MKKDQRNAFTTVYAGPGMMGGDRRGMMGMVPVKPNDPSEPEEPQKPADPDKPLPYPNNHKEPDAEIPAAAPLEGKKKPRMERVYAGPPPAAKRGGDDKINPAISGVYAGPAVMGGGIRPLSPVPNSLSPNITGGTAPGIGVVEAEPPAVDESRMRDVYAGPPVAPKIDPADPRGEEPAPDVLMKALYDGPIVQRVRGQAGEKKGFFARLKEIFKKTR